MSTSKLRRYLEDEFDALPEQMPALQAVLQSYEEIEEIVRGRVPVTHYSPTLPMRAIL